MISLSRPHAFNPETDRCVFCDTVLTTKTEFESCTRIHKAKGSCAGPKKKKGARGLAHRNGKKTHCYKGHKFTVANTYINSRGARICRKCQRIKNVKKVVLYRRGPYNTPSKRKGTPFQPTLAVQQVNTKNEALKATKERSYE